MTIPTEATKKPLVSIVVPVFNDEEYIARALDTALNQSLKNIEIICIDDCSTDSTVEIIERFAKKDSRIKLIKQPQNASAFQARRAGVEIARAEYILFLDGDDELHKDAAKLSYKQATKSSSDIVGFGSKIVRKDGSTPRDFENSVQPKYEKLTGFNIVARLFEPNQPAQGSMWRYLFSRKLLLNAYAYFPEGQSLYRSNDLPISFLSTVLAKKYTSINNKLYIYHYYAGGSGSTDFTIDKFKFYTQAIDSIDVLGSIIDSKGFDETAKISYDSARLFVLSNILRQITTNLPAQYHGEAIQFLLTKVSLEEIVYSTASFIPEALNIIRSHVRLKRSTKESKNVAIFTNNLNTGGVQGVVVSQAKYLQTAGFNVTILLLNDSNNAFKIPEGIKVILVKKGPIDIRLKSFKSILVENDIDTVIDHNILYNFSWPFFSLVAKSQANKTLAWLHSFALRPMTEGKSNGEFLIENMHLIDDLVVLSKPDVSYWKSLGHKNVFYLPNPPSPLLLENSEDTHPPKQAPKKHLNIIWFGRLQQATKKVYSLIDIAAELKKLTDNFTLTIIGPDSDDLKLWQVKERVKLKSLKDNVKLTGPKHGSDLIDELKKADLYISTSIIEGYPLTLLEAQSYALPVLMYELPWLAITEHNDGIIETPQKNPSIAAQEIYNLFIDRPVYERTSKASLVASQSYLSYDFSKLYTQLLKHSLPKEFSPAIRIKDLSMFAKWTQLYFTELIEGGVPINGRGTLQRKDAEIAALLNSKTMKVGNAVVKPLRVARSIKHKLAKHLKNR